MTTDPTPGFHELTVELREGSPPGPGPCVRCSSWTETGLGFSGDEGWRGEGLRMIVPDADISNLRSEPRVGDREPGHIVRLCLDCAHATGFQVGLLNAGEGIVTYPQPRTGIGHAGV